MHSLLVGIGAWIAVELLVMATLFALAAREDRRRARDLGVIGEAAGQRPGAE